MRAPRSFAVVLLAAALVGGLSSCSTGTAAVTTVSVADAPSVLDEPGLTVIDVRTPAEFASGHLDGAVNVDFESGTFAKDIATLPVDGEYFVYCRSGNRSGQATTRMAELGFTQVYNLDGGITAWASAGGSVVTS